MYESGNVVPRIIWTLATAPDEDIPFLMSKVDLKDGCWRMVVSEEDSYNLHMSSQKLVTPNQHTKVKDKKQKFEEIMMNFPLSDFQWMDNTNDKFWHLMEVYVDDFILLLQTKRLDALCNKTQNLLHAIYSTFSKQELNQQSNPISVKKLEEEGVWETQK